MNIPLKDQHTIHDRINEIKLHLAKIIEEIKRLDNLINYFKDRKEKNEAIKSNLGDKIDKIVSNIFSNNIQDIINDIDMSERGISVDNYKNIINKISTTLIENLMNKSISTHVRDQVDIYLGKELPKTEREKISNSIINHIKLHPQFNELCGIAADYIEVSSQIKLDELNIERLLSQRQNRAGAYNSLIDNLYRLDPSQVGSYKEDSKLSDSLSSHLLYQPDDNKEDDLFSSDHKENKSILNNTDSLRDRVSDKSDSDIDETIRPRMR